MTSNRLMNDITQHLIDLPKINERITKKKSEIRCWLCEFAEWNKWKINAKSGQVLTTPSILLFINVVRFLLFDIFRFFCFFFFDASEELASHVWNFVAWFFLFTVASVFVIFLVEIIVRRYGKSRVHLMCLKC